MHFCGREFESAHGSNICDCAGDGGFQVCRKVCIHVYEMTVTCCGFLSVCPCVGGVSYCSFNKNDKQCFCMKCGHAFINLSVGIYLLVLDNYFFKEKGRFHSLGLPLFEELRSRGSSAFQLGYMGPWNGFESCLKTGLCSIPEPASWARTLYPRCEQSQESNQSPGTRST